MKITNHIWLCANCKTKLFLRVDSDKPQDVAKLTKFQNEVTKHCLDKDHCVIHKEKGDFQYKYV